MPGTKRRTVQTQFLVFTLFGDYILPRGGNIWTSDLLYLLELLGVSERAARSVLSRMAQKGWVIARKEGRRSQYSLTAQGWSLLEEGGRRIFEPSPTNWDGLWHLVIYSIPEDNQHLRHALRQRLGWLGFGRLVPATWVSPHNRTVELENIFNQLEIQDYVEVFSGMRRETSSVEALIKTCWDLPQLEAEYQDFIIHHQPEYKAYTGQHNGSTHLSPDECFVKRFWLTHDFQPFPLKDPNLPTALLSTDWVGFRARQLFDNYRQLLESYANQFIDEVVKGDQVKESLAG